MRASRQKGIIDDHAAARDAQTQFEAIVMQLLGCTIAIIGLWLETTIPAAASVSANRQRQGVNNLNRVGRLATDLGQALLNVSFDLP